MKFIKKQILQENVEEVKNENNQQEVLTEAVRSDRSYEADPISQAISDVLINHGYTVSDDYDVKTDLDNKVIRYFDILETLNNNQHNTSDEYQDEMTHDEVDKAIAEIANNFHFTEEEISYIEDAVNKNESNPQQDKKDSLEYDLGLLEDFLKKDYSLVHSDDIEKVNSANNKDEDIHLWSHNLTNSIVINELEQLINKLKGNESTDSKE